VASTTFLVAVGLALCAVVTLPPVWILMLVLGRDPWPPPGWIPVLAGVTIVPLTAFTTLCTVLHNVLTRWFGGVELTLAEAPAASPDPGPRGPRPAAGE
jgi:hypothetical protein